MRVLGAAYRLFHVEQVIESNAERSSYATTPTCNHPRFFIRQRDSLPSPRGAFPTDNEINLLLAQADRAMQQYKPLIDQEELQFGKSSAESVAKDREVVRAVETALQALRKRPQGFNSAGGFALFEWLDDASRNAMVCSTSSMTQATVVLMGGDVAKAKELIHLGQSCMDVSNLIYTVSENAGALYERYTKSVQKLATDGADAAQQCAAALKKMGAANKERKQ